MEQVIKELYTATLSNGNKIIIVPRELSGWYGAISQKKKDIIRDLNSVLGEEIVVAVRFYGYADIDRAHKKLKDD